jgi:hypothetical protein
VIAGGGARAPPPSRWMVGRSQSADAPWNKAIQAVGLDEQAAL